MGTLLSTGVQDSCLTSLVCKPAPPISCEAPRKVKRWRHLLDKQRLGVVPFGGSVLKTVPKLTTTSCLDGKTRSASHSYNSCKPMLCGEGSGRGGFQSFNLRADWDPMNVFPSPLQKISGREVARFPHSTSFPCRTKFLSHPDTDKSLTTLWPHSVQPAFESLCNDPIIEQTL